METEVASEENTRSNTDDAVATEGEAGADDPAGEEAAKAAAAEAGEGSGDRTDGPEAAGASGATPTIDPSAAAAVPGSKDPQPGAYLKAATASSLSSPWRQAPRRRLKEISWTGKCSPPLG